LYNASIVEEQPLAEDIDTALYMKAGEFSINISIKIAEIAQSV
jgi:hypothetical protein